MFLTWLERAAVALSIATVLANAEFARAAEQNITPIAGTECQAMARKISQSVGIQLSTRVGGPDFVADFLRGVQGNVCLMSGRATGLNTSFDKVRDQLNAVLSDWTPVPDIYLDDVAATAGGFAKGAQRVIYVLEQDPPRACQNTVISACKVPARRWTFSLKVGAFATSTQSGM